MTMKKTGYYLILSVCYPFFAILGITFFMAITDGDTPWVIYLVLFFFLSLCVGLTDYAHKGLKALKHLPQQTSQPNKTPIKNTSKSINHQKFLNNIDYKTFELLIKGILDDNKVTYSEAVTLQSFLDSHPSNEKSLIHLGNCLDNMLADGHLLADDAEELRVLLGEFIDSQEPAEVKPKPIKKPKLKPQNTTPTVDISTSFAELEPKRSYHISYTDSVGNESEREIFVSSIKTNKVGNTIVYARCKQANASRSFRLDRINEAIDTETGELVIL